MQHKFDPFFLSDEAQVGDRAKMSWESGLSFENARMGWATSADAYCLPFEGTGIAFKLAKVSTACRFVLPSGS